MNNEMLTTSTVVDSLRLDGYTTVGHERDTNQTVVELIAALDAAAFAAAVVAPEDREIVVHNRRGNDRMLALAREHNDRLIPACAANPWWGDDAVAELRRAVGAGARMLVFAPALQGFLPNDGLADELCTVAGELNVPVYVHSGPHSCGSPAQIALWAMQHPGTRFILGHGGSTDHAGDLRAVLELKVENLWFETSLMRPWAFDAMEGAADESRWVFGSNAPRNRLLLELDHLQRRWPYEKHAATYGQNLLDVFHLTVDTIGRGGRP